MAYDYSLKALQHPEAFPVFVDIADAKPFEPAATELSLVNAWWLANVSQLVYFDLPALERELENTGLELIEFFSDAPIGTQACLLRGDGFAIFAFRGTEVDELEDVITDFRLSTGRLFGLLGGGPLVHRGFRDALNAVWKDIAPHLEELSNAGTPVWFTGHSLGAALATLAAARHRQGHLYTFGSPRVGRPGLARLLRDVHHERFVNCFDLITFYPPALLGYSHLRRRQFFDHQGGLTTRPRSWAVIRARLAGWYAYWKLGRPLLLGWVPSRAFVDHGLLNYQESIRRAMR